MSRRRIIQGVAWATPAIVIAAAAPARAASTEPSAPTSCTFEIAGAWMSTGTLHSNGNTGSLPIDDGNFGTGWTPPAAPSGSSGSYTSTEGRVAPGPAGWWQGGGLPASTLGFMSLDDNDNTAGGDGQAREVTAQFRVYAGANTQYELIVPVYASASYLGAQYLDIDVEGPGIPSQRILERKFGDESISVIPAGKEGYVRLGNVGPWDGTAVESAVASVVALVPGYITVTLTFTLAHVTGGARQNADFWVAAPITSNCAL